MSRESSKEKWEITIDVMLIIGKYFEKNNDFVNVMKVTKNYCDLTKMYHYNPIEDTSLFENMETQHFYSKQVKSVKPKEKSFRSKIFGVFSSNNKRKKSKIQQYVYWYNPYREIKENERMIDVFVVMNSSFNLNAITKHYIVFEN